MKATFALILAGALAVTASPVDRRALVTDYDITTVTAYVYPDGAPATHLPQPTDGPDTAAAYFKEDPGSRKSKPKDPPPPPPQPQPEPQPERKPAPAPEPKPAPEPLPIEVPSYSGGSDLRSVCVDSHNIHRANHSAPAIEWDSNLAAYAQELANSCNYDHNTDIGGGGYGQNIAMRAATGGLEDTPGAARKAITGFWYNDEYNDYPGFGKDVKSSDGIFKDWGHLSQMVWADTKRVGCAIGRCPAGTMSSMDGWFAVCNYSPAGNVPGKYAQNVKPAKGMATAQI